MQLQGPVPLHDRDYVERPFEVELVRQIQAGRWILLLGPRQHGKTSALLRLRRTLNENAAQTVLVDLQAKPPLTRYAQFVTWFAGRVAIQLNNLQTINETDDLSAALAQALRDGVSPIVILIDEASNIDDDQWRNSFFGQLRAISSERAAAAEGDISTRLRFVFSGTFRPERLVAEANSPFNICERVDSADLSREHVLQLVSGIGLKDAVEISPMIYDYVGGQPYLVQRLIQVAVSSEDPRAAIIDEFARLADSDHVSNLFRRVLAEESLSEIVSSVASTGSAAAVPGDDDQRFLIVLGLLERNGGSLRFRNRLYATTACGSPQFAPGVAPEPRRAVLFSMELNRFASVSDAQLREIAYSAQRGAVAAHREGSCRIALAGFGTAMEAVLIDFLKRQSAANLTTAAAHRVNPKSFEIATNPASWNLINLMRGARGLLGQGFLDIPENLREWRNLIHPGVAVQAYKPDSDFFPEVGVAAHQLDIILRDLP